MKRTTQGARLLLLILSTTLGCLALSPRGTREAPNNEPVAVIPKPEHAEIRPGSFAVTRRTRIVCSIADEEQRPAARHLARRLRASTGYPLKLRNASEVPPSGLISFIRAPARALRNEGYRIDVDGQNARITAADGAGFRYGVETFLQLFPPEAWRAARVNRTRWCIPCVSITDEPRFRWRGMHLDVSRHFFPKEFVKTYLDMLAVHKMNIFHWHLTDDQGWRIEIKKYPRLTAIGAWRVDREGEDWEGREPQREDEKATYGGFYTQNEIREIVAYATDRHITIVPEIEMPAHATAALAAYPQFSCSGGPFTVATGGVWPITDIFCAGNDSTFTFLQDILGEVMSLFPGEYIHIGGDEADKTEWRSCLKCQARLREHGLRDEGELQSYFIRRIERFLRSRGRRLVGWDEIIEGGLAPDAIVMSWRGMDGGIAAAQAGHDVVMTPGSHCYFDYYQGKRQYEPPAIGGYTPLSKVYSFEPVPDTLSAAVAGHILGAQANVWTEYIASRDHAQYMSLPRMAAIAEAVWSPREARDWEDFVRRVERLMERYDALRYRYARSAYLVSMATVPDAVGDRIGIALSNEMGTPEIRYTLDGSEPSNASPRYHGPFSVDTTSIVRAAPFRDGKPAADVSEQKVVLHDAVFKPVALTEPYEKYSGGGEHALVDGILGTQSFDDGSWQGFHGTDLEAVIDLGEVQPLARIATRFLEDTESWIFAPTLVEYSISSDGVEYASVGRFENPIPQGHRESDIREIELRLEGATARYVKLFAKNVALCPAWHAGSGEKAWIFADEIVVEADRR